MAFRDKLKQIFYINDTPHRIALSFSIGIFMGISPFLGLHTVGAIFLAWVFRLNKLVAFAGVAMLNPWTLVPVYSLCLWVGAKLTGVKQIIPDIDWADLTILTFMEKLGYLVVPFIVGTLIIAVISALISYFIIHKIASKYKPAVMENKQ
ncbi:MAG: DUF2062 domain-containing protein [Nitrospirae bacterium]|nr:DUF2062 domain-containing protein [Nitrospirota bacterium]